MTQISYDYFIALPMSGISDDFRQQLKTQLEAIQGLLASCGKTLYCAELTLKTPGQFDTPLDSYRMDIDALKVAKNFLLIWPHATPSGALIELGMAIEKGMPITVLQAEGVHLPWMCRAWGTLEDQGQFLIRNYGALGDILRLVSEDVLPKEAQRLEAAVRRFSGAASDGPSPNSPVGCQPGAQQGAPPPQPRLY